MSERGQQHITQHRRFVPYGTHPNSAFGETSFTLGTLYEMHHNSLLKGERIWI